MVVLEKLDAKASDKGQLGAAFRKRMLNRQIQFQEGDR
jgi:hypothetical protein